MTAAAHATQVALVRASLLAVPPAVKAPGAPVPFDPPARQGS